MTDREKNGDSRDAASSMEELERALERVQLQEAEAASQELLMEQQEKREKEEFQKQERREKEEFQKQERREKEEFQKQERREEEEFRKQEKREEEDLSEQGDRDRREEELEAAPGEAPVTPEKGPRPATGRGRSRAKKGRKREKETALAEAAVASHPSHKKKGKGGRAAAAILAAVLVLGGGGYVALAQQYRTAFFPGTEINGMDVSGKTIDEVEEMIAGNLRDYVLTLEERDNAVETISGEAIGLHPEFDGSLSQVLAEQNPYEWLKYQFSPVSYLIDTMAVYEEEKLEKEIQSLSCMDTDLMREPENSYISQYVSGQGYHVEEGREGTVILPEVLSSAVAEAITSMKETLSLEEAGAYKEAEITAQDPGLLAQVEAMNRFAAVTVTYRFGDQSEELSGERIHQWIVLDQAGNADIDEAQVAAYVEELAASYNTANKAKTVKTSYGTTIEVQGGTYGWRINQAEETASLAALIRSGESGEREPIYSQTAASRGENDYGNTYVEINLTAQHLFFYKDGSLVVESDFVSGNLSRGWGTPAGTYPLTYKQRNAVLKGENYRTPVDYWMPFNRGIGMHDAKWRGSFGGTIYKTNGSHGCINLPHSVAKTIYENISSGTPVICYNLSGTETKSSTAAPAAPAPTAAPAETAAPVETQPETPEETAAGTPVNPQGPASYETAAGQETPAAPAQQPGETQAPETSQQPGETQAPSGPSPQPDPTVVTDPTGGQSGGGPSGPSSNTVSPGGSGPGAQ